MTTKAVQRHKDSAAQLGCYLCRHLGYGPTPAQLHHVREGQGMAQRASDWLVVPLCDKHHANSSPDGIHGGRKAWKLAQVDEMDALADTLERLYA
jgi:hypothetical protein